MILSIFQDIKAVVSNRLIKITYLEMRLLYSTPENKAHIPPKEDPTLACSLKMKNH